MKAPKISLSVLIVIMLTIILLSFAFVHFQNNNRKLDLQEQKEEQERKQEAEEKKLDMIRAVNLTHCLTVADEAYFDYAKLNGTVNKDGSIRASNLVWSNAQKNKDAAVKICEIKYGK